MPNLEQAYCLFHPDSPPERMFDRPDWWHGYPGAFAWHRCSECGLHFLSPRPAPDSIEDYYPNTYAAYRRAIDDEPWSVMRWKRRRNLRPQITAVEAHATPGRLLDVGCATGNFLAEMRKRGWQVNGVELQPEAAGYAQQRFGLDVFIGDLLESQLPGNSYDAITMWDVLEHTYDPLAIVQEAHRLLKPGGLLAFSIPDLNSNDARTFGPAWIGYDSPRHLYLFGHTSLQLLLREGGFELMESRHFMATYHTWVASLHTYLNSRPGNRRLRRIAVRLAYLPFWSLLTNPYFAWLNRRGRGAVLTVLGKARVSER